MRAYALVEALLGMLFAAYMLLRERYDLAAAGTMTALPSLFPWYFSWLVPLAAITADARFRAAALTASVLAMLGDLPLMYNHVSFALGASILAMQWIVPIGVYFAFAPSPHRSVR